MYIIIILALNNLILQSSKSSPSNSRFKCQRIWLVSWKSLCKLIFTSEKALVCPYISHRKFSTNHAWQHEYFLRYSSAFEVQWLPGIYRKHDDKANRGIKLTVDFRFQSSELKHRLVWSNNTDIIESSWVEERQVGRNETCSKGAGRRAQGCHKVREGVGYKKFWNFGSEQESV
jgi:hypothetical protein